MLEVVGQVDRGHAALTLDESVALSVVDQANGGFSKAIKVDVLGQPVTFKISDFAASQAAITTQVGGANVVNLEASNQ